ALLVQLGGPRPQLARELVASAVHLVVQLGRNGDGSSRITHIAEVAGAGAEHEVALNEVFAWSDGQAAGDGVHGRFVASGFVPRFCEDIAKSGVAINQAIFRE